MQKNCTNRLPEYSCVKDESCAKYFKVSWATGRTLYTCILRLDTEALKLKLLKLSGWKIVWTNYRSVCIFIPWTWGIMYSCLSDISKFQVSGRNRTKRTPGKVILTTDNSSFSQYYTFWTPKPNVRVMKNTSHCNSRHQTLHSIMQLL